MPVYPIVIEDNPDPVALRFLEDQIIQYNYGQTEAYDGRGLAIFLRNDQYEMIAGVSGYTWAKMCEIEFLWVREDQRGQGLGSQLLKAAEDEARLRGCLVMILSSYSFQAPGLYLRHGFEIAGSIEDCPPGHTNHYFVKRLL